MLSIEEQMFHMKALLPESQVFMLDFEEFFRHPRRIDVAPPACRLTRDGVAWSFDLQPTPFSASYRIIIEYWHAFALPPRVWPRSPKIKLRGKDSPPHYNFDGTLCLFCPDGPHGGEWTHDKAIAHTIVPWTSKWLFFYEAWLMTGEWLGGGIEASKELQAFTSRVHYEHQLKELRYAQDLEHRRRRDQRRRSRRLSRGR